MEHAGSGAREAKPAEAVDECQQAHVRLVLSYDQRRAQHYAQLRAPGHARPLQL
jgi:hypothetical protein